MIVRRDRTIASLGFNGFPRGVEDSPNRLGDRDLKNGLVVHAEMNAILMAREPLHGMVIYCTHPPCSRCAGPIIQAGISEVVAIEPTPDMVSRWGESFNLMQAMFDEAGVELTLVDRDSVLDGAWDHGIGFNCPCCGDH